MSTYTVKSLADAGTGSGLAGDLRYCVSHATSGNDTIAFGVTGKIESTSPLPRLNTSVVIEGPGADRLTVEPYWLNYSSFRVFTVGSFATVQVSGLTISNGRDTSGGAINNAGTLTVSRCILTGNSAYDQGGAIYGTGTLTVNNSTLSGNHVDDGQGGGDEYGGAISLAGGVLSINSSTLAFNRVQGGSGIDGSDEGPYGPSPGWPAGNGFGGALYIGAGAAASINHSTIASNEVVGGVFYSK